MKQLIYVRIFIVLLATVNVLACSHSRQVTWRYQPPEDFAVVQAVGYAPISLQQGVDDNEKLLRAMKASKLGAYEELVEQVYGRSIDGNATVNELVLDNNELDSQIKGVIRGANVVRSYALGDTYVTEMELDFREVYRITMSMAPTRHLESEKVIHF